jgi:hypothetical protein
MLADELARAQEKAQIAKWDENEGKIRSELKLDLPPRSLSADTIAHIRTFESWAKAKGVRKCPCKPFVLACFIQEHHALGVPSEQIIAIVKAVDDLHQYHSLASPLYTQAARSTLAQAVEVPSPRGWNKDERVAFDALVDPLIRQAVSRHEWLRDRDLRRRQNEISELKKQLGSTADESAHSNEKDFRHDQSTNWKRRLARG